MPDNLTKDQRSYSMSRVKNKDTDIEKLVQSELAKRGLAFQTHLRQLPGSPDIVFPGAKLAVFVDGDFWHGYRFPAWQDKVSDFWREKISINRRRDRKNFRRLRRMGWTVIRIWQHQVEHCLDRSIQRILEDLEDGRTIQSLT